MELARLLRKPASRCSWRSTKSTASSSSPSRKSFAVWESGDVPYFGRERTGVAELLEAVLEILPEAEDSAPEDIRAPTQSPKTRARTKMSRRGAGAEPRETKIAIIGRPNVGKSTLLNALTGDRRSIVSPVAGTTRDAVDELVERDGHQLSALSTLPEFAAKARPNRWPKSFRWSWRASTWSRRHRADPD